MKKLIIFDAYGTLITTGTGSLDAAAKILSLAGSSLQPELFYGEWKKLHREHMAEANRTGFMTEEEIFRKDLEKLYEQHSIKRDAGADAEIMLATLGRRRAFEGTPRLLAQLREKYTVVIGSNSDTAPLMEDIRRNGLETDGVFTSEKLRKYKPDRQFYDLLLKECGCLPEDTVFVGDSLREDVSGPAAAGIPAILVDRRREYKALKKGTQPLAVVHSLCALTSALTLPGSPAGTGLGKRHISF